MDGKGRALDNIFTERLWRTVKYEEVYLKDYASPRQRLRCGHRSNSVQSIVTARHRCYRMVGVDIGKH
jgi:hypothetical protein